MGEPVCKVNDVHLAHGLHGFEYAKDKEALVSIMRRHRFSALLL